MDYEKTHANEATASSIFSKGISSWDDAHEQVVNPICYAKFGDENGCTKGK